LKRKIALILSFVLILTLVIPAGGFAANMDKALENAIKIANTKFTVPQDYKFSSSISTDNKKNIFNLNWNSSNTLEPGSINVRVDETGTIIGYSKYSQSDYIQTKKLPKFSRQEAKTKADAYIKGIDPTLSGNIKYEENAQSNIMDTSYYLNYYRVVNGVPFYNDRVTVTINRETGALQDFNRQWTDNLTFPAVTGTLSVKNAQEAYVKNLGLKLIYKYTNTDDVLKTYAVYTPIYDNGNYGVNALTGELQRISNNYYGFNESAMMADNTKDIRAASGIVQLSPDELKAVQNASELMSLDEAEKIARSSKFLSITTNSKLESYNLNTNWPSKEDYIWSLQFNKPASDKTKYNEYTSVTVNAKTGEITGFYRGVPAADNTTTKVKGDLVTAKAAVDTFLQENYPQYYRQAQYDKLASESNINGSSDTTYNFIYSRIVNGIIFPDNGLNVTYDNVSGTITGFNLTWFNIAFPSVDKAIGTTAACEKLFGSVGLNLNYKSEYTENIEAIKIANPAEISKVVLVYALDPNKPLFLDANTGSLLNQDGDAYKETVKVNYSDIKGNAAEKQIMVLADNGVYLEGAQFMPNSEITQKDFLTLLSKTLNYYGPVITEKSALKDIDELYAFLQREGVVKAGEKVPDSAVTREDAVKFLIRALKYDKVADIKGIFNIGFEDKASISPSLSGYVAIAAGLGIIDTKSAEFKPKEKMTRGESAIMIYNYLQS
jgi:hypothetical protein